MMAMQIVDNALSEENFEFIKKAITEEQDLIEFPWYLQNTGVSVKGDGSFQFTHQFCDQVGNRSSFDYLMKPLYYYLGVNKFYRCKINLTMKTKETHEFYPLHTDQEFTHKTAIYYLNTNNGYTLFEDGTKVDSVANRMVLFEGNTLHTGATQTDERFRYVINFNYW